MKITLLVSLLLSCAVIPAFGVALNVKLVNRSVEDLSIAAPGGKWVIVSTKRRDIEINDASRETLITLKRLSSSEKDEFAQRLVVPEGTEHIFFQLQENEVDILVMLCDCDKEIIKTQELSIAALAGEKQVVLAAQIDG